MESRAKFPLNRPIAVIGLGYVGLPLAIAFAQKGYSVVGFDTDERRISALANGEDQTGEATNESLQAAFINGLKFSYQIHDLADIKTFIVAVPTPIDRSKKPDLGHLESATSMVGGIMGKDSVVIYESTVYPGCTEEFCVPILERESGLSYNQEFFVGYSPERINPGEKTRPLSKIVKITSGSTAETAEYVDLLYRSILEVTTFKATSIKVAEAAKVIENTQRDLNIAFVNELALLFDRLNIDTHEVLKAAGTKWNFLPFTPGLVGGHCIGVDPYYLTHKAQSIGYIPEIILAGRRINDSMGVHVAQRVMKLMTNKGLMIKNSHILILGITFKENFGDIRNSKVVDIVRELESFGANVSIYDPLADSDHVKKEYDLGLSTRIPENFDAVILAVSHDQFLDLPWKMWYKDQKIIFDVKGILNPAEINDRL